MEESVLSPRPEGEERGEAEEKVTIGVEQERAPGPEPEGCVEAQPHLEADEDVCLLTLLANEARLSYVAPALGIIQGQVLRSLSLPDLAS